MDPLGDRPAVHRSWSEDLQDEEIQRALHEVSPLSHVPG
jgi:hypothetical protein